MSIELKITLTISLFLFITCLLGSFTIKYKILQKVLTVLASIQGILLIILAIISIWSL